MDEQLEEEEVADRRQDQHMAVVGTLDQGRGGRLPLVQDIQDRQTDRTPERSIQVPAFGHILKALLCQDDDRVVARTLLEDRNLNEQYR